MNNLSNDRVSVLRSGLVALTGAAVSLMSMACAMEDDGIEDYDQLRLVEVADDISCVTLYAGQTIEVGTVCVAIDNEADTSATCGAGATGAMTVTYATTGGWTLGETHLAAGDQFTDIPATKKGNPKIGNFPHASGDISGATEYEHTVPLCDFGLDGADTACEQVKSYLAAHAVVNYDNGDGTTQSETAWGDGDRMVKKGSWAEYFNMHLKCKAEPEEPPPPPEPAACETAFALAGNGDETCFIGADFDGDGADDGINRWGWSNVVSAGTNMQWPVYAAAGQCNLGNGELVGHLSVAYDGNTASVTFDRVGGFTLDEEHLYIGTEPLARDGNGDFTVAPGQYPVVVDLDDATQTSHSQGGFTGEDIYIVYHGVACGDFGGDDGGDPGTGGDGGGDGGPVCDDPLAAMNDDFDGDLSAWSIHNAQDAAVSVGGGELEILPVHGPGWYASGEAVHVNQTVSGNFAVSSYVEVTTLAGGPTAPGDPYRVGGLMIRDPLAATVNSYHLGIGNMATPGVVVVSKSTDDSSSQVGLPSFDVGDGTLAEMKICRVGADVQGLIRLPGQPWTIVDWHVRPDLPADVVAGPISYAWDPYNAYTDPDLRTTCDYVRYETVQTLADCMKDYDPAC